MLQPEILRTTDFGARASGLEGVAPLVRQLLDAWPGAGPVGAPAPIARFEGGRTGTLVQVGGRPPAWSRRAPRRGRVEGRLVYAVGDVHGCYDLLADMLTRLGRDATAAGPGLAPVLVLLGDYVDRGPDSARVLELLSQLRGRAPFEICLLKGNHEEALLNFLDDPAGGAPWIAFGGAATLASYGVDPPGAADSPAAYVAARDALLRGMPAAHLRLLQSLPVMAVIGDYAFVHAGVAPGTPLRKQSARDLLWIRGEFLQARGSFGKIIVHGHTWADDQPVVTATRVGLDTGAYETGVLSAVRIDDERCTLVQVRDHRRPAWRKSGGPPPWRPVTQALDYTRGGGLDGGGIRTLVAPRGPLAHAAP